MELFYFIQPNQVQNPYVEFEKKDGTIYNYDYSENKHYTEQNTNFEDYADRVNFPFFSFAYNDLTENGFDIVRAYFGNLNQLDDYLPDVNGIVIGASKGNRTLPNGSFVISDPQIVDATAILSAVCTLDNETFVVAYDDSGLKFKIYDINGEVIGSEITVDSDSLNAISPPDLTKLDANTFVIIYRDTGNSNYVTYAVYDRNNEAIVNPTAINSTTSLQGTGVADLNSDHFVIVYNIDAAKDLAYFQTIKKDGTVIHAEEELTSSSTLRADVDCFDEINCFFCYRDVAGGDDGSYQIWTYNGTELTGETDFQGDGIVFWLACETLNDTNVVIGYMDGTTGDLMFDIYNT